MRFKHYWKNKVDESLSRYENPEYLQQLKRDYVREDRQKKISANAPVLKIRRFAMAAFCLIAMTIAIFGGVYLAEGSGISNDKTYLQSNEITEEISLLAIENSLQKISILKDFFNRTNRIYDELSKDTLYYFLKGSDGINNFEISITNNSYFNYNFSMDNTTLREIAFLGYNMEYNLDIIESESLYQIAVKAKFDTGAEKVYITYNELSLDGNSNFLDFISTVFTAK